MLLLAVIRVHLWHQLWPGNDLWFPRYQMSQLFSSCNQPRCILIDNSTDSDAVLISHTFMWSSNKSHFTNFKLPSRPSYKQKWVFVSNEAPISCPIAEPYLHLSNVTFTHQRDSHVFWPFGRLVRHARRRTTPRIANGVWESRKNNVVWEVSNCNTSSAREMYVRELSKHIDVSIYGKCGTHKSQCRQNENLIRTGNCYSQMSANFKFYLAFENSLCKDFVTEKLWRTFQLNMIPIVYGHYTNYKAHLPQNSFINIMDFSSPNHLADHLYEVSRNKTLYELYISWKRTHRVQMDPYQMCMCQLCDYLHKTKDDPPKTVNLREYWSKNNNCISPHTFLHSVGVI